MHVLRSQGFHDGFISLDFQAEQPFVRVGVLNLIALPELRTDRQTHLNPLQPLADRLRHHTHTYVHRGRLDP